MPSVSPAALAMIALMTASPAWAQSGSGGPPAVGTVIVEAKEIVETTEINGRIEAIDRIELSPRVTAYLDQRLFVEGAEVKKGDLMFCLERAPFEAEVEAKRASVAQAEAQLENAELTLVRAEQLVKTAATSESTRDKALETKKSSAAQLQAAKAQLWQAEINLGYTEIYSPIDGRVGRTAIAPGNVVSPSSGPLASIVSQDPIYVTFPVPVRRLIALRDHIDGADRFNALRLRLRRADGRLYQAVGKLQLIDISVARDTDTIILRGIIPNPVRPGGGRELTNGELVRVILESGVPRRVLAVPRAAVLTDQQGDYLFVVDDRDIARQRRVTLGQSTAETAAIIQGLSAGEKIVVEGLQKVRADAPVAHVPASPPAGRS